MVALIELAVLKMLNAHKVSPETYDFKSMWDSSLTAGENFTILREDLKAKGLWKAQEKEIIEETKAEEAKAEVWQKVKLEEEEQKLLDEVRNTPIKSADIKSFASAECFINAILNGKGEHGGYGLILEGEGGLGKSFLAESKIKESKISYAKLSGHTTPLGLFAFIQRNNEKELILIDDVSSQDFKDENLKAMMKAMLWKPNAESKRILQWNSFKTENELKKQGLMSVFEVKPRFILICNKYPTDEDSEAIKSRCLYKKVEFTRIEKLAIMYEIAKKINYDRLSEAERIEVVDYIKKHTSKYTIGLDIRTLIKAFYLRLIAKDWQKMTDELFGIDEELKAIDEMTKEKWCAEFGKTVRTYYRKKAELERK